jgi:DNA topoisomerase I
MTKTLVIVESPAKAKTINKYLGKAFIVKSSIGHIRDLPKGNKNSTSPAERAAAAAITRKLPPEEKVKHRLKKAKEQLIRRMGIDPNNDWDAVYEVIPGKDKVVSELKKLAENSDKIYLATDLDREGEAIAWHLQEAIGGDVNRFQRVVFNEITAKAIKDAFSRPSQLNIDRVNAQQARRFLDRVVGFMVSPLLWSKVARGLSAGRVQSVAVKLLVEREKEIKKFIPDEYWTLSADCATSKKDRLKLEAKKYDNKVFKPTSQQQMDQFEKEINQETFKVDKREDKPSQAKPNAPFITSTLQQAASSRLGFGVKKTMMLAQRLYERGYITYMRTDSTNLSAEAVEDCRAFISSRYGDKYIPEQPRIYGSSEGAQEAHEAIRPSSVLRDVESISDVDGDAKRVYQLIWERFVACQMMNARYTSSRLDILAGKFELRINGRVMIFDGFTRVMLLGTQKEEDRVLPDIKVGEILTLEKLDPQQHFTKPPARFSEAALVKELEKKGIGRPSTYASIISTIQDRGYAQIKNKRFYAEKIGEIVTDRLDESFSGLMDYNFTANMEKSLDKVADGELQWKVLLDDFYADFSDQLEHANSESGMRSNAPTLTDISCDNCSRKMQIRNASTGVFLGCSGYMLPPKERCKHTKNLIPGDEFVAEDGGEEAELIWLQKKERCSICNTAMESYLIDENHKMYICGNNPDCDGYRIEEGQFKLKGYEGPLVNCDKCESDMHLKSGRFGKYFGCTNEACSNTRKLLRNGEVAPPKMDPVPIPDLKCIKVDDFYVLRDGAAGMFLAASQFPKNRETRAPLLKEILPYAEKIDEKYDFLFSGPVVDNENRDVMIRYSRKNKEHYLMTEIEGKASGWKAFYRNKKWDVEISKKRVTKNRKK